MTNERGRIIVVSGPSGAGKDTLIRKVLDGADNVYFAVSATTRKPREGEEDGREYYFLEEEEFNRRVDEGDFIEHKDVFGQKYGTLKSEVERGLSKGNDVLLELDVKGALAVKRSYPEACLVFIAPPSLSELERRIKYRGLDDEEEIEKRLEVAPWEMDLGEREFDRLIVNDDADAAAAELEAIVRRD